MLKIISDSLVNAEYENIPTKNKIDWETGYNTWLIIFKVRSKHVTILGVFSGK